MKTSQARVTNYRRVLTLSFFAAMIFTFNALTAHAQSTAYWTTVGSGGATEDESNPARPTYTNNAAAINDGPTGNYILRYNVVATDGLFNGPNGSLVVRFRDTGPDSRVLVELKRTSLTAGGTQTVATFDSDAVANPYAFTFNSASFTHTFDFADWGYWLEVTMTRSTAGGIPAFAMAKLQTSP